MWTKMFTDCVRALQVDTSNWPAVSLFLPPPSPRPVPPPPPPPPIEGTTAQPDLDVAVDAENLEADL